ncbi:MAG: hypothetical protein AAGL17_20265, partial [Cyanobacteria bacterium J06576_12]
MFNDLVLAKGIEFDDYNLTGTQQLVALDFITKTKAAIAQLTDPEISSVTVDINNCDREPIHIPNAIQPHGVLLVLSPKSLSSNDGSDPDWTLVQVSQNTAEYLGKSPESLINQPLSVILSVTARQALQQCIAGE